MLNINKELLKDLLFHNILGLIEDRDNSIHSQPEFKFEFSPDRKQIDFTAISEEVYGATCWEEDEQKKKTTSLGNLDMYEISETVHKLVIQEHELKQYNITNLDENYYWSEIKMSNWYGYEGTEEINVDYYYNLDKLRTLMIPIEEMTDYLLTFKYAKPVEELVKNLEFITPGVVVQLLEKYGIKNINDHCEEKPDNLKKLKIK
jgi:hypothetical protein